MSYPTQPGSKWLGLALVFTGLGLIPMALLAFKSLQVFVSEEDFHLVLVVLMVFADVFLIIGVLILMPQGRSTQRRLN
ncbi:MAG TPA: hypothetical protein VE243_10945 [Candidatus Acidoferrum sp.]|nr:hypothetical protein [Candidatus Acidoferrum sp.]